MASKLLKTAITLYFLAAMGALAALYLYTKGDDPAPVQPINFSHVIHADRLGLECTHCHVNVDRSPRATAPTLSICMECHTKAATDREEIIKLTKYWNEKKPVEWVKVHNLPWHVHFTHKRHIKAGIDCAVCHGEVRAMARIRRVRSLKMGWCLNCHRSRQAPTDCTTCHK